MQKLLKIPFTVEMARKVQDGNIQDGKITTRSGFPVKIASWNFRGGERPILALISEEDKDYIELYNADGTLSDSEESKNANLIIEIPEINTLKKGDVVRLYVDNSLFLLSEGVNFREKYPNTCSVKYYVSLRDGCLDTRLKGDYRAFFDPRGNFVKNDPNDIKTMIDAIKKSDNQDAKKCLKFFNLNQECGFKAFDKVLIRDYKNLKWRPDIFLYYNDDKEFVCANGVWTVCIPYKGNEHLIGKDGYEL